MPLIGKIVILSQAYLEVLEARLQHRSEALPRGLVESNLLLSGLEASLLRWFERVIIGLSNFLHLLQRS